VPGQLGLRRRYHQHLQLGAAVEQPEAGPVLVELHGDVAAVDGSPHQVVAEAPVGLDPVDRFAVAHLEAVVDRYVDRLVADITPSAETTAGAHP